MAKVRADQLEGHLKKGLAPIYIVSGDEPLLVQECCQHIRQTTKAAGFLERDLFHADNSFDWGQLLSAANSLSLFADQRLLEVRIDNGKPGDKGSKALLEYAEQPSNDNILLLVLPKLDGSGQRAKWFKALEKIGLFIQVWPISPAQLPRWINQRLSQAGIKADREAVQILADRVEGNLLAAVQEIEKLKLIANPGEVLGADKIAAVVMDSARYDVFGLVDKALMGDARSAVKNLLGLKGEGTDATVALWALAREIRTLYQVANDMAQGQNPDWAMKNAGVWDKRKPLIKQAVMRLRPNQLQLLLRKANNVDKAIKGLRKANPWDELLDLVINLAGTFSLSPKVQKMALKN